MSSITQKKDSSSSPIKGPPLGSPSHTLRLFVMLTINSFLIGLCIFILPLHLLWRQASKNGMETSNSSFENLKFGFNLMFQTSSSNKEIVYWINRSMKSTLAAVVLSQTWFIARFKGWWDEAESMELGDKEETLKRRKISMLKQLENVTLTTFTLPILGILVYLIIILLGAPLFKYPLDTLILSGYISILIVLPTIHLLENNEIEWKKNFSLRQNQSPRSKILIKSIGCTILGGLISSLGFLLDWDKAWQIYPIPTIFGLGIGLIIGNFWAEIDYYFAAPKKSNLTIQNSNLTNSNLTSSNKKKKKRK